MTFYNEFDPFAAKWLRGLVKGKKISEGIVDERDFRELGAADVAGHERCHFFAGIGGWDLALQYAGWEGPVWTASLPCQPFSAAGKGREEKDERHLFPDFAKLVSECKPAIIFGEQTASAAGLRWLDGVRTRLEAEGYAVGAADLCAASVGAPHKRQRIFWVAEDANGERRRGRHNGDSSGHDGEVQAPRLRTAGNPWGDYKAIRCADGETRRVAAKPELFPVAHGTRGRMGLLRGYGNAIVPQVAAEFVMAYMETS